MGVTSQMQQNSMEILNIRIEHLDIVANLALHHRDPFDRCDAYASDRAKHGTGRECARISQAIVENLPIVGVDKAFDSYAVRRFW